MTLDALLIVGGLGLLAVAADRFVRAAARLARAWGVSGVLVGALVLGLGTSAPELVVSVLAALRGQLDLAVGNVVGSNLANVTLVLGLTALVAPLAGHQRIIRREGLLMLAAVTAMAALMVDGRLSRPEAVVLVGGMVPVIWLLARWSGRDTEAEAAIALEVDEFTGGPDGRWRDPVVAVVSLGAILAGAELLVRGATGLAVGLGLEEAFVGMTVVAVGTSLPELGAAVAAARHGEQDLVMGNVLGSNLFNSLAVMGAAGVAGPGPLGVGIRSGLVLMVAAAVVTGVLVATGDRLQRWEGVLLVAGFAASVAFLA